MNRRLLPLLLAAVVAAPAVQGCGAEDVAGVDVAQAVENTTAKQTARITGLVTVDGFGLPDALRVPLTGVTSLTKPDLDLQADVGKALAQLKPEVGSVPLQLRIRGGVAYLKVPEVARGAVPKAWARVDLRKLGLPMSVDGASLLRALRPAGKLKNVGTETIGGARTTHLRGSVRLADVLLSGAGKGIAKLAGKHADEPQAVDVWIDGDDIVRRERAVVKVPGSFLPAGAVTVQVDYRDFGTPLATDLPAKSETFDATQMLATLGLAHAKTR
jgi:hypothetical protein